MILMIILIFGVGSGSRLSGGPWPSARGRPRNRSRTVRGTVREPSAEPSARGRPPVAVRPWPSAGNRPPAAVADRTDSNDCVGEHG